MDGFRLFLHVLAACVWVGGQITVAGLLPTIRGFGEDAPRAVAQRFGVIGWTAYAVLMFTGIWNFLVDDSINQAVFGAKFLLFAIAGAAVALHSLSSSRAAIAIGGAVGGLASIGALLLAFYL